MPIYTFYPQTADGAASMFEAEELRDDASAIDHCLLLLAEHLSASEVVVWEGDRRVHREIRARLKEAPGTGARASDGNGRAQRRVND